MEAVPRATIVVPTRDRPEQLERTLAALERHQLSDGGFDVIVIDDGSREAERVAAIVEAAHARLVRAGRHGASAARNAAEQVVRGPFICFVDDDCEPDPGWAERLVRRLEHGADVVLGPTEPGRHEDPLARAYQLIANALVRTDARPFAPSSNVACRREVLARVPFDARYWPAEDRDWYARLAAVELRIEYEPEAIVRHFPELDLREFCRKNFLYGRGAYRFRRQFTGGRLEPPHFYARLLRSAARDGPSTLALVALAQVVTTAGFFAEAVGQARGGRRKAASLTAL